MASWASHVFERTRGKVIANMERNASRRHTELQVLLLFDQFQLPSIEIPHAPRHRSRVKSAFRKKYGFSKKDYGTNVELIVPVSLKVDQMISK
ncbi:hypothetical protein TNCV_781671 [Trichonephila clavipes]|nr:hypothetical protein TNCV_781671 [Trichonephila clavipes]